MNDFARRLPWRLAALAGLVVGGVSWVGGTDLWACLTRIGTAFVAFGLMGIGLRILLESGQGTKPVPKPPASGGTQGEQTPTSASNESPSADEIEQRSDVSP